MGGAELKRCLNGQWWVGMGLDGLGCDGLGWVVIDSIVTIG
jgi:hypothetical protein